MYRRAHCSIFDTLVYPTGLSLCIQGTLQTICHCAFFPRFIPVYTGNTKTSYIIPLIFAVYPCVYRKHPILIPAAYCWPGLSLCIQGTLIDAGNLTQNIRFIPVYTGNTPIITYCFIIKILTAKFLPIFLVIFYQNLYL